MFSYKWNKAILWGLFTSVSTLLDWYWNAPLHNRPFSVEELYRYEMFLERPKQALAPPNLVNEWLMVMLAAAALFFLGYISMKVTLYICRSIFITLNSVYLKAITGFGLLMGFCAGYILLISAYMLPLVWSIYMAVATVLLMFIGTYLVLRSLSHLYLWWKQKRICA